MCVQVKFYCKTLKYNFSLSNSFNKLFELQIELIECFPRDTISFLFISVHKRHLFFNIFLLIIQEVHVNLQINTHLVLSLAHPFCHHSNFLSSSCYDPWSVICASHIVTPECGAKSPYHCHILKIDKSTCLHFECESHLILDTN